MAHKLGARHAERRLAFHVLYGLCFAPADGPAALQSALEISPAHENSEARKKSNFPRELVFGVERRKEELDAIIGRHSDRWKVTRIAKIELSILRLAVFEILYYEETPTKVAIDEALELAKAFGDEHSKNFINGILDAVAKEAQKEAKS